MTSTRIMIVEDDEAIAEQLAIHLNNWGYQVCGRFHSGEQAIAQVGIQTPDLILMDIILAGDIDGIETTKRIQGVVNIPIIFTTACTDEQLLNHIATTEAYGYLVKPINRNELRMMIQIALNHSKHESQLSEIEQHLSEAQRISLLGSWDWDIVNNRVQWSNQMYRIFHQEPQSTSINLETFLTLVHPDDRKFVQAEINEALYRKERLHMSYRILTNDRSVRRIKTEGEVYYDADKQPIRMLGTAQDITEIAQTQDHLWHLAHHDPLTGLANRNLLLDRINQACFHADRENKQIAVMLIDLDHFKYVNDEYGHDTGDELLKTLSTRLRNCLRDEDTLARYGGDEFVIVGSVKDDKDAIKLAQKALRAVHKPIHLPQVELLNSASIGIALYPHDGQDSNSLLKSADLAMYDAKQRGKNTYSLLTHNEKKTEPIPNIKNMAR